MGTVGDLKRNEMEWRGGVEEDWPRWEELFVLCLAI